MQKEDMLNIRSCIKKRGTISQRKALSRWEKTLGYMLVTKKYEELEKVKREISRLKNVLFYTEKFIARYGLLEHYNKKVNDYITEAS